MKHLNVSAMLRKGRSIGQWALNIALIAVAGMAVAAVQPAEAQEEPVLYGNQVEALLGNPEGFGWSVAVDGVWLAVGAPFDNSKGTNAGAVYLYTLSKYRWEHTQVLTGGGADANFGISVATDGETLVIGATEQSKSYEVSPAQGTGMAYIFVRQANNIWLQQGAPLTAPDKAVSDLFGSSVAVHKDTVVIGAAGDGPNPKCCVDEGSVYVFVRTGGQWALQGHLFSPDRAHGPREPGDLFGDSVAVDGDTLVVGAPWNEFDAYDSGSAYVYQRSAGKWSLQQKLDMKPGADFATSVAISGDRIVVGSPSDDSYTPVNSGRAYVFQRSGSTWSGQQLPLPPDRKGGDFFGGAVAISGTKIIVGASGHHDDAKDSGGAFLYSLSGTGWRLDAELSALDLVAKSYFGGAVATDGSTAVVANGGTRSGWETSKPNAVYYFSDIDETVKVEEK